MKRTVLTLILLLTTSLAMGANDIWQNLFKEKLQEAKQGNSNAQYDVAASTRTVVASALIWPRRPSGIKSQQLKIAQMLSAA